MLTEGDVNIYQAVVLADSFNDKFEPLTRKCPKVLMPVVNAPVLEYTLSFLRVSGIQLVYLFCSKDADKISQYIESSQWSDSESSMKVVIVVAKRCLSLGDALRELDARAVVRNDFVLLSGDTVANVQLRQIIDDHRERYKKDKRLVMTMLYKPAHPRHRTRSVAEETVLVLDDTSQRILHHQNVRSCKKLAIPLSVFQESKTVSVRHDLLDCQIAICSPQFIPLFSDNFDFQTRDDFIKGILVEEEILGNIVNLYELDDEYAARISNFHMYDAVSKDIIDRWVYPFVPDNFNTFSNQKSQYSYLRHNVYKQKDVTLARSCVLKENVVIGPGTKIGTNSTIMQSVIGCNCTIGDNVTLQNAYIWDNVVIADGCHVTSSLIASGAQLRKNVKVSPGCIISCNVVVGPAITLGQGMRLTDEILTDDDEFSDGKTVPQQSAPVDTTLVGPEGKGYVFCGGDQETKDLLRYLMGLNPHTDDEDATDSDVSEAGQDSDDELHLVDDSKLFYKEVLDSLTRAVNENVSWENLVLEINSSKYAYNVTMREVNSLVTSAIMSIPSTTVKHDLEAQEYFKALKPILDQFAPLFKNYMKSLDSQSDCLNSLEDYCSNNANFAPCLMKVLNVLYDKDVLSEDAILRWYNQETPENPSANHKIIRKQIYRFIVWLQEAEEESDD